MRRVQQDEVQYWIASYAGSLEAHRSFTMDGPERRTRTHRASIQRSHEDSQLFRCQPVHAVRA